MPTLLYPEKISSLSSTKQDINLNNATKLALRHIKTTAHEYYSPTNITISRYPPPTPCYVPRTIIHHDLSTHHLQQKSFHVYTHSPTLLYTPSLHVLRRQYPLLLSSTIIPLPPATNPFAHILPDNWTTIPQFLIFKIKVCKHSIKTILRNSSTGNLRTPTPSIPDNGLDSPQLISDLTWFQRHPPPPPL